MLFAMLFRAWIEYLKDRRGTLVPRLPPKQTISSPKMRDLQTNGCFSIKFG